MACIHKQQLEREWSRTTPSKEDCEEGEPGAEGQNQQERFVQLLPSKAWELPEAILYPLSVSICVSTLLYYPKKPKQCVWFSGKNSCIRLEIFFSSWTTMGGTVDTRVPVMV